MISDKGGEVYRGEVHNVTGKLAFAMLLWNLMRIAEDGPQRHLLVNVFVYAGITVYEDWQVRRHFAASGRTAK